MVRTFTSAASEVCPNLKYQVSFKEYFAIYLIYSILIRITIEKYGRTIPVEQEFETKGRKGMTHLSLVPVGHFDYYNFWVSDKVKAYIPSSCLAYVYFDGILASTSIGNCPERKYK